MDIELNGETSNSIQPGASAPPPGSCALTAGPRSLRDGDLQQRFTQALQSAADEVFEMMVGTALGPADHASERRAADYTAMIGLAGDLCGVISFCCSHESAARIAAKMLGTDDQTSEGCLRDALGEICNMVAGSFKGRISDVAKQCMLSVPTVVSGKDYRLYPLVDGLRILVSRNFEGSLIWMALDLHSS